MLAIPTGLLSQKETSKPCRKNGFNLTNLLVPCDEIKGGGPPRDGIPSIDKPDFTEASNARHVFKDDYVLGVFYNGVAKAYPVRILDWHEIVNDYFGDTPVAVTWCPLCGSGMSFIRKVRGIKRTFGVSGLLYNSDVLLYDRQSLSLWSQIMGKAIAGPEAGADLEFIPTLYTTFEKWRARHPNTLVLTQKTGVMRDYFSTPYEGYDHDPTLLFRPKHMSKAFKNKERVVGVEVGGQHRAYPFSRLKKQPQPVRDTLNGVEILIHYDKKSRTAVAERADGAPLRAVTLFWFAWYGFHPDTSVFGGQ